MTKNAIDSNKLFDFLEHHFTQKRKPWQKALINTIKMGNWGKHRKYFFFTIIFFFVLFAVFLQKSVGLSKIFGPAQNPKEAALYIILSLTSLVFSTISMYLLIFSALLENTNTYEDYLHKLCHDIFRERNEVSVFLD